MSVPGHVILHQDNTGHEGRNQWLMLFAMDLIAKTRVRSVSAPFYMVGHTHCLADQRFSHFEQFCEAIRDQMPVLSGRQIVAEYLRYT